MTGPELPEAPRSISNCAEPPRCDLHSEEFFLKLMGTRLRILKTAE